MNLAKKIKDNNLVKICTILLLGIIAFSSFRLIFKSSTLDPVEDYQPPVLNEKYTNDYYRFSLDKPEDFSVREMKIDSSDIVIIERENGEGIQIYITPYDKDTLVISEEDIRNEIPDMKMEDVQVIEVGDSNRGIAFLSDNQSFGGESREVWFVFNGYFYQISTFAKFDLLLQSIFATWEFNLSDESE